MSRPIAMTRSATSCRWCTMPASPSISPARCSGTGATSTRSTATACSPPASPATRRPAGLRRHARLQPQIHLRCPRQHDRHAAPAADAMGLQGSTHATTQQSRQRWRQPETTYYVYDAGGQRVRKVTERQNGTTHRRSASTWAASRSTASTTATARPLRWSARRCTSWTTSSASPWSRPHDDTAARSGQPTHPLPARQPSRLGSVELDETVQLISYEEYHPYGTTPYQAMSSGRGEPKRYRYTGKERDEETGFTIMGRGITRLVGEVGEL